MHYIQKSTFLVINADRQHALFSYICHLSREVPPHRTLCCASTSSTPEWKHHSGRHRRMWLNELEEDFRAPISTVYIAGEDWSNWRSPRFHVDLPVHGNLLTLNLRRRMKFP